MKALFRMKFIVDDIIVNPFRVQNTDTFMSRNQYKPWPRRNNTQTKDERVRQNEESDSNEESVSTSRRLREWKRYIFGHMIDLWKSRDCDATSSS